MSIADKITSMTNHLEKDYQALESVVGTVSVNKNIENIAPLLDNLWEELPKVTGTGTSLSLSTRAGKMKLSLKGNTSQTGTPTPSSPIDVNVVSGDNEIVVSNSDGTQSSTYPINLPVENLLGLTDGTYSDVGITAVVSNGEIVLNGTATANSFVVINLLESISIGGTNHIVSLNNATAVSDSNTEVRLIDGGNYENIKLNVANNTRTLNNNRVYTKLQIRTSSGVSYNDYVIKPQLEKGTKANSFTPYGTTPIEMCKIGTYQDKFIRNSGKNLCTNVTKVSNTTIKFELKKPTTKSLTLQAIINEATSSNSIYLFIDGNNEGVIGNITGSANANATGSITLTDEKYEAIQNSNDFYFQLYKSGAHFDVPTNVMLNEGSTALPYEPYGNGEWYLEKHIGKVVVDGTEAWGRASLTAGVYYFALGGIQVGQQTTTGKLFYCNYFKATNTWSEQVVGMWFDQNMIAKTEGSLDGTQTLDEWKTWLSTHNLEVYYVLATPTYTKITYQPLIEQLNAVYRANTYNTQTNFTQINNDLPFELDVTALEG